MFIFLGVLTLIFKLGIPQFLTFLVDWMIFKFSSIHPFENIRHTHLQDEKFVYLWVRQFGQKTGRNESESCFKLAVAFLHPLTGHQHADCAAPEKQANQKHRPGWTNMVMCAIFMSAVFHDLTAIQCSDDKELRRWDNSAVNEDSMSSCPCRYVGVIVAVLSLLKLLSRYSFFTFWVFELSVLIGFLKTFWGKLHQL